MPIFANDDFQNDADRLDHIWDRLIQTGGDIPPELNGDDAADAAFAAYLHQIAPSLGPATRDRLRARLFTASEGGFTPMNPGTTTSIDRGGALIASLPLPPRSPHRGVRRGWRHHPLVPIAAALLLVIALTASWLAMRNDDPPSRPTIPQYAATSPESNDSAPSDQQGFLEATPGPDSSDTLIVPFNLAPITWEIPEGVGEVRFFLIEITLDPGASWSTPFSGATQLQVQSGSVAVSFQPDSSPNVISSPDGSTSYTGDGQFTIGNSGFEPATVIQGTLSVIDVYDPGVTLPDGVTVRVLAAHSTAAGSGPVYIHVLIEQIQGTGGTTTYYLPPQGLRLITLLEGTTSLIRMGGTIDIYSEDGPPVIPNPLTTIGTTFTLHPGNAFFAHPGSGFSIASSQPDTAWLLVLAVYPASALDNPIASPVASPVIEPITETGLLEGALIAVMPSDCTIEARPVEEFTAIMADPFAEGTPVASPRNEAPAGVPADQATIDGVTDTIKQIVACNSPATRAQMNSLYSANLLRFLATLGVPVEEFTTSGSSDPAPDQSVVAGFIALEDVVIFPDGRVGAMVNADGEVAYVTFVFENGRWLIDFWDDQLEDAD